MKETGKHFESGQFDGWELHEIEEKLMSLAQVIYAHQPLALAAHAQWSEYDKFKANSSRAKYLSSPYKALFHEITRLMYHVGRNWQNPQSVDFIFDGQGDIGEEAASWYSEIKAAFPPDARPLFGRTPGFEDDLLVLALQAADMFAWFQRRRICQPVTRPGWVKIEELITNGFAGGSEIGSDGFEKAAVDFEKVAKLREQATS